MLPRGAATPEDKRAMQTPSLASSSCLLPLAKGMAHTPPGARPRGTASHPHPTARYTNRLEVGAGASHQESSDSGEGRRRVSGKKAAKVPGEKARTGRRWSPNPDSCPAFQGAAAVWGAGQGAAGMTHLDNGEEAGLAWAGHRGGGGPTTPPRPREPGREGAGSRGEGSVSPLNPRLCPPLLATLLSTLPGC